MTSLPEEGATTKTTTNIRRRRNESSGWDHPPAVASPSSLDYNESSWVPRECHWRTPQRLFALDPSQSDKQQQPKDFEWGNLLCAPIVVSNRYILVASDTILSVYGNFDSHHTAKEDSTQQQQQRIDTKPISPLTKFSLSSDDTTDGSFEFGDKILQMDYHEDTGIVYILTVESSIYQVKLIFHDPVTKRESQEDDTQYSGSNQPPPRFEMRHNWITRQLGATCMTTWSNGGDTDTVCVGYKSGNIEAWKVPRLYTPDPTKRRISRQPRNKGALLEWDGFLYDSIRTLSFLPPSNKAPMQEKDPKDLHNNYLMVVLSIGTRTGDNGKEEQTSSMLKILDLKQIADEKNKSTADSSRSRDAGKDLPLEKYSLPQSQGMELIDASTVLLSKDGRLPKRVPVLDGHGANAACRLSVGQESSPLTGIAFPDGIVGIFSRSEIDGSFEMVGIVESNQQLLLSFPAIGNGQISMVEKNGKSLSYLATCLRGGTCYLIPISTEKSNSSKKSIAAIPFPHDMDSDLSNIYVQAFMAGNLLVDGVDLPVLVYAWSGGVIDVYSCGLMDSKVSSSETVQDSEEVFVSRAERRCLRDLIDNESISLVAKILDELRDNSQNPLLQTDEWNQLFKEIKAGKTLPTAEDITLESLCSMELQSLRRVLLSMALVNA